MTDDPDLMYARLDRLVDLAHQALSTLPEDRARMERPIQLVCQALQAAAWAQQQIGTAEQQTMVSEIAAPMDR